MKNEAVSFTGKINIDNSSEMRSALGQALRSRSAKVIVDLSGVTYIDTSGLATLVEAARIARKDGTRLVLSGVQGQARYLLEITRLDQIIEIDGREVVA